MGRSRSANRSEKIGYLLRRENSSRCCGSTGPRIRHLRLLTARGNLPQLRSLSSRGKRTSGSHYNVSDLPCQLRRSTQHLFNHLPIDRSQWISRFESASIIIASTIALVWLTGVQRYPFLIFGPAAAFLKLAPIWYQVYFPTVLLTVAEIVRSAINLVRPDWTLFRAVYSVFVHCGGAGGGVFPD